MAPVDSICVCGGAAHGTLARLRICVLRTDERTSVDSSSCDRSRGIFHVAETRYRCVTEALRLRPSRGILWCYTRRLVDCVGVPTNLTRGMKQIAIVGGGPAGALCGERLATSGFAVTIFDERLAWEKHCSGGLTDKAVETYPFLLDSPHPKKIVRTAELISSRGHRARFEMDRPIVIYARKVLNGLLLDRAVAAGCTAVCSRVTSVNTNGERVRLMVDGQERISDFVVLASGARNQLLPDTTKLGAQD